MARDTLTVGALKEALRERLTMLSVVIPEELGPSAKDRQLLTIQKLRQIITPALAEMREVAFGMTAKAQPEMEDEPQGYVRRGIEGYLLAETRSIVGHEPLEEKRNQIHQAARRIARAFEEILVEEINARYPELQGADTSSGSGRTEALD